MQSGEIGLVCSQITVVKDRSDVWIVLLWRWVWPLWSQYAAELAASEVLTVLEWCARTCPFWWLLWQTCFELFVTCRGWRQTCLWIVRYNSQDATVLCYTLQFVQRHQTEMISHGAMRVYENSVSNMLIDGQPVVEHYAKTSQLKMEWLVDQKLWYAAGDWVWTRRHQIWQGLDTVNCGVAMFELHWDILPGMQVGDCRFCLLLCKPEYRPRIAGSPELLAEGKTTRDV